MLARLVTKDVYFECRLPASLDCFFGKPPRTGGRHDGVVSAVQNTAVIGSAIDTFRIARGIVLTLVTVAPVP